MTIICCNPVLGSIAAVLKGGTLGIFAGIVLGLIRITAGERRQDEGYWMSLYCSILECAIYWSIIFVLCAMVCVSVISAAPFLIRGIIVGGIFGGLIGAGIALRYRRSSESVHSKIVTFAFQGAVCGAFLNFTISLIFCK